MIVLAIDCSASLCAASVWDAEATRELGRSVLDIGKGHAERLMGVIDEALMQAGKGFPDIGAVAVSIGPGSFTGVRVGVSTARGLALALKIPAIGVNTLEALAAEARESSGSVTVMSVLDAGRGEIQAAVYDELGAQRYAPSVMTLEQAAAMASEIAPVLAGTAAHAVAAASDARPPIGPTTATADIAVYARLAALKGPGEKPRPLYLRAADAKPQAGFVLPRRDG